jgi:ABC-2 type transport system ATP-binding protein
MKTEILNCQNVGFETQGKKLLENINFSVYQGQRIAILGHNGAGKSTLIDLLTQAFKPSEGKITWPGSKNGKLDPKRVGVVFDELDAFIMLTVGEVIRYFEKIYGIMEPSRSKKLIQELDHEKNLYKQVRFLSKGERKKLWLILAILHQPELLIMDEATAELDPSIKKHLWEQLILEQRDRSMLFTTHSWEEAQQYADWILFLSNGKMTMPPQRTQQLLSTEYLPQRNKVVVMDHPLLQVYLQEQPTVFYLSKEHLHILPSDLEQTLGRIRSITPNFSVVNTSLMDVYALSQQKLAS